MAGSSHFFYTPHHFSSIFRKFLIMKLTRYFIRFHTFIILALFLLGVLSVLLFRNQNALRQSREVRFNSHMLAEELRHSSEDLTKFCRIYIITGDSIWADKYQEVLDVRNGIRPWPNGDYISLRDSMQRLGFSRTEMALLTTAEDRSNALVSTERKAMHAINGLFQDEDGLYTLRGRPDSVMARNLMFNQAYLSAKQNIMAPIDSMFSLLYNRTTDKLKVYYERSNRLLSMIIALIALTVAATILLFFQLKSKLINKLDELRSAHALIEQHQEELKTQNAALDEQIGISNQAIALIAEHNKKLDDLNTSKDKFFSIISHDLRGPVGAMQTYLDLINQSAENSDCSEMKEHIRVLLDTTTQVNNLLNNLLTWARTQSGKIVTRPVTVNLREALESQVGLLRSLAQDKEIALSLTAKTHCQVEADRDQTDFVFRNLLSNAIKYTPRKGRIDITITCTPSPLDLARVDIRDNGVGMSPKVRDNLFQIGQNSSTPGTEGEQGTGLGLILCYEFLNRNHASISVESAPGQGTCFSIFFHKVS